MVRVMSDSRWTITNKQSSSIQVLIGSDDPRSLGANASLEITYSPPSTGAQLQIQLRDQGLVIYASSGSKLTISEQKPPPG
jgi:hypothetical protein